MDCENLLNLIDYNESTFYVSLTILIIGAIILTVVELFGNDAWAQRNICWVGPIVFITFFATLGSLFTTAYFYFTNDSKVEDAFFKEAVTQNVVVIDKREYPMYTDYTLQCGRLNNIAARIPTFEGLSGEPVYAVNIQNLSSWVHDTSLRKKIDDAINLYEIYGNK